MFTKKTLKKHQKYACEKCDFKCSRNIEWNRHIASRKHLNVSECLQETLTDKKFTCECGKVYNYRQSLYVHKKNCQPIKEIDNNSENDISKSIVIRSFNFLCFKLMRLYFTNKAFFNSFKL